MFAWNPPSIVFHGENAGSEDRKPPSSGCTWQ